MKAKSIKGYRARLVMANNTSTNGTTAEIDLTTLGKLIEICDALIHVEENHEQPDEELEPNEITHRCDGTVEKIPYDFNSARPCPAFHTSDGKFHTVCGEPCRWMMIKEGEGNPPWRAGQEEGNGL